MQIRRVYKQESLKFGKEEIIDEKKMMEIYLQADIFINSSVSRWMAVPFSQSGSRHTFTELKKELSKGIIVETFFSEFSLVSK